MLYWIKTSYAPNTAEENLVESRLKGILACGEVVTIVFLRPSVNFDRKEKVAGAETIYPWKMPLRVDEMRGRRKYCKYVIARLQSWCAFSKFIRNLKSEDVVIADEIEEYFRLLFKSKARIYVVRGEHLQAYEDKQLKAVQAHIKKKAESFYPKADGVFPLTTSLKEYFLSVGVKPEKITIVNMVVDDSRFDGLTKTPNTGRYIAYCGTVSIHKDGVDDLIKSFALVHEAAPDVKLLIMGKMISAEDERLIKDLIDSFELNDFVVLTGLVPATKMPQRLKDAALLALTRTENLQTMNGFPTKLAEYLLTENPVVATKTGDIPLFLEDGESALLAEPGNIKEIASKMIWALTHPEESGIIGRAGAEVAKTNFNYKTESQKIMDVIYGI
jgi:glycosyltransferase involved in cell wall biosynthesis